MNQKVADAVVIGGGILGASVAHFLAKRGFGDVVLLERRFLAAGATGYSAANVRQHYSTEIGCRLARRAVDMFEDSEERLGGPTGFTRVGYLVLAGPEDERAVRTNIPVQQGSGIETEILTVDQIADSWPTLDLDGIALAGYERTSGYADPTMTVRSLVSSAEKRYGLELLEGNEVTAIDREGDRIVGVQTSAGPIATEVVVNAAGPWADRVGRLAAIEHPLTFSREHEAVYELPVEAGELAVTSDAAQGFFYRPHGDGAVLMGETYPKEPEPCDPETYDDSADREIVDRMARKFARRVPAFKTGARVIKGFAGVYSITPDWYPILGEDAGVSGYYTAIGGSGHGYKIGPPMGESLAAAIAGDEPPIDISPLAPTRFEAGETFTSAWGPGNRA